MAVTFAQEASANEVLRTHTPCDSCGVRSSHVVLQNDTAILSFCGHHTRKNATKLKDSYTIFPEDYGFPEKAKQ